MHVFGLTGGYATGKSTVARRFAARGVPVIDADELARDVVLPKSEGLAAVVQAFGPEVLAPDGSLDRKRLGGIVFADGAARARLEALLHPRIQALMLERTRALEERGEAVVCYEAPLLVEVGLAATLRPLVVVTASDEAWLARAQARDELDCEHARARARAQLPLAEKTKLADYVIDNSGPLEQTLAEADRVLDGILAGFGVLPERYRVQTG